MKYRVRGDCERPEDERYTLEIQADSAREAAEKAAAKHFREESQDAYPLRLEVRFPGILGPVVWIYEVEIYEAGLQTEPVFTAREVR